MTGGKPRTIIAPLIRFGGGVVKVLERAGANFARLRGADLLRGWCPDWLRRVLQSSVLPSTLATDIPLPFAFGFDATTYAAFDPVISGENGLIQEWLKQLDIQGDSDLAVKQLTKEQLADALAAIINDHVAVGPDGTLTVVVPQLWFRDP